MLLIYRVAKLPVACRKYQVPAWRMLAGRPAIQSIDEPSFPFSTPRDSREIWRRTMTRRGTGVQLSMGPLSVSTVKLQSTDYKTPARSCSWEAVRTGRREYLHRCTSGSAPLRSNPPTRTVALSSKNTSSAGSLFAHSRILEAPAC